MSLPTDPQSDDETFPHPLEAEDFVRGQLIEAESLHEDDLQHLGTEAIEQLASGLNKAATTIQEFGQNSSDEERLKQLNDDQLLKLLEEAYQSKKHDDKNKRTFFKEILEDVKESISIGESNIKKPSVIGSGKTASRQTRNMKGFAGPTSTVTIPSRVVLTGNSLHGHHRRGGSGSDDSSSTKTEIEEMDQFSDLEDQSGASGGTREDLKTKRTDENGNAMKSSISSLPHRQLRPLSIYRHNPAFHSQHVSVNQTEGSPPPHHHHHHHHHSHQQFSRQSPLQQQQQSSQRESDSEEKVLPSHQDSAASSSAATSSSSRLTTSKTRRKKKVDTKELTVNAEEIDGYRGNEDIDRILEFIEATPATSSATDTSTLKASKKPRRTDHRRGHASSAVAKASRTPSATPGLSKETSAERQMDMSDVVDAEDEKATTKSSRSSSKSSRNNSNNNGNNKGTLERRIGKLVSNLEPERLIGSESNSTDSKVEKTDSATTAKPTADTDAKTCDSLSINSDVPLTKPLVTSKPPKPSKPSRSGQQLGILISSTISSSSNIKSNKKQKSSNGNKKSSMSETDANVTQVNKKIETQPLQDNSTIENVRHSNMVNSNKSEPEVKTETELFDANNTEDEIETDDAIDAADSMTPTGDIGNDAITDLNSSSVHEIRAVQQKQQQQQHRDSNTQPSFNYDSILRFIKNEWDIFTLELTNGSTDIQSKVVYYKPHEQFSN